VNIIESNIEKIRLLCSKHKVSRLFVFGSVLKDSFNKDSDIDLVVDFSKIELDDYADNYFDFKEQLESIFNRPVDLLEEKGIRNPFLKKQIDVEKQLIYGT
jgi:predicted nucleotidyltransferase